MVKEIIDFIIDWATDLSEFDKMIKNLERNEKNESKWYRNKFFNY